MLCNHAGFDKRTNLTLWPIGTMAELQMLPWRTVLGDFGRFRQFVLPDSRRQATPPRSQKGPRVSSRGVELPI